MAIPVTLRSVKGDTLTFAEMDGNFGGLANANVTITAGGAVSTILADGSGLTIANTTSIGASLSGNILSLTANLSAPGPIGATTASTGAFTTVTASGNITSGNLSTGLVTATGVITTGNVNLGGNYLSNTIFETVREKVFALGTVNGAVTVNADLGSIQTMTAASNITINTNNLTNFQTGESVSVVITQGTNANLRVLTSNILFAGGTKTLSTANAAVDTVHITYDGTYYLAALVKGYA